LLIEKFINKIILLLKRELLRVFFKQKIKNIIKMYILTNFMLNANIITTFFLERLRQRYKLGFLVKNILIHLKQYFWGVFIKCQGRFTRAQRAKSFKTNYGKIPFSNMGISIDYSFKNVRLKYGLCGIKVWICNYKKYNKCVYVKEKRSKYRN
jgi:ribosomal protein S3